MACMIKRKRACVALRDTLLPRLISGQLRLPEAQAATEAALGGAASNLKCNTPSELRPP